MSDKNDNVEAYNAELEKIQKRYKEKLRGVLNDAREKYRFTISELILKELFDKAAARNNDLPKSGNEENDENGENGKKIFMPDSPDKAEIMRKTQEAVKAFAKTALTKTLIEYVKDVQTLNSAFGKNVSGDSFSKTLNLDKLTEGLTPDDLSESDLNESDSENYSETVSLNSDDLQKNANCDNVNVDLNYGKNENNADHRDRDNDDSDKTDVSRPLGVFCPNDSKELN